MLSRFLVYGVAGWTLEVLFTGVCSAIGRDASATSKTYLWMHPIYGAAALGMEQIEIGLKRRSVPLPARAAVHTLAIYGAEYGTGFLLKRALGKCPWDYSAACGRSIQGLVRLDYAPLWYAVGVLFTLARPLMRDIAEPPRSRWSALKRAVLPNKEEPVVPRAWTRTATQLLSALRRAPPLRRLALR